MPVDLLSYQGNAGLGLGSNPDISVPVTDLRVLNDTMRNLMLLDNEKNIKIWQQKVKDRDQLEALILNNQVSTGEIDPKDQKYFDKQKAEVEKAYDAWGGNFNDTAGFRKYQAAVAGLQDTATHAQTRWAGLKQLQTERAKQSLPSKIKAYDDWIAQESKKPFGEQIVPYQQLHDFSIDDINSGVVPVKSQIIDPNNPISYDVATVDYNDILKNKRNDYLNDQDKADSMDQFSDKLMRYNQPQLQKTVAAMDAKIAKYNAERGFKQGDDGYVNPVKVHKNDDGTILIAEPKTELAAKWALANQDQFVTRTPKFNKDILKGQYDKARLGLEAQRNEILAKKANIEQQKANAYVKHLTAATKKIVDTANQEGTDITKMYNDFVDHVKPYSMLIQTPAGTKNEPAVFMDDLPQGYQFINGAVVNDKSGKVTPGQLVPFRTTDIRNEKGVAIGRPFYVPKYVDAKTGEEVSPDFLFNTYKEWRKGGFSGTKDEMVNILLKQENSPIELILKGKNGSVNYSAMSQAARVINNLGGAKKGQENIINPPEAGPDSEEPAPPPENPENN